ncbi:hypothetical protein GJ496_010769 [Pomphorhynchus laevis]|nr:hypothetical protein GJ496_010769 [Pomphorhynchus laevis]
MHMLPRSRNLAFSAGKHIIQVCRSKPRKNVNTTQTEADELTTEYKTSLPTTLSAALSAKLHDTLLKVIINKSLI